MNGNYKLSVDEGDWAWADRWLTSTKKEAKVFKKKAKPQPKLDEKLEKSIADAIKSIKKSDYKGTAIKVELEAELRRDRYEWEDGDCHSYILDKISDDAREALVYSSFFVDGSVDSELTFTYMLDDLKYVVEVIKAFKSLANKIGNGLEVEGAGMHVAILNSKHGEYPEGNKLVVSKFNNMKYTVSHLMPALFFLASSCWRSRGLGYRLPRVERSKYSAINGTTGALEFRVFETCYDNPEIIYDFVCVIAKCLQFYSPKKVDFSFFGTIGELGMGQHGTDLGRFYTSVKHLDALDAGLEILKPNHKTIEELKRERNFRVTREKLVKKEHKLLVRWKGEYGRFNNDSSRKAEYNRLKTQYRRIYRRQDMDLRRMGYSFEGHFGRSLEDQVDYTLGQLGFPPVVESEAEYIGKKRKELLVKPGDSTVMV